MPVLTTQQLLEKMLKTIAIFSLVFALGTSEFRFGGVSFYLASLVLNHNLANFCSKNDRTATATTPTYCLKTIE
jgi:hypothetical protein